MGNRITPATIPEHLLVKYQTRAPRYTSYPTAPHFRTEFDPDEVRSAWMDTNAAPPGSTGPGNLSVYVHLPFCARRCLYCGCTTEVGHDAQIMDRYVTAVAAEADHLLSLVHPSRPAVQLALGGGTPSSLPPELMTRLVTGLWRRFIRDPSAECSIEIDPRSVDTEYLDLLIGLGFNRFSFGVQDFDPGVLSKIGRVTDAAGVEQLVGHLRRRGIHAVNMDIMYGLPGQTEPTFHRTMDRVAAIRPSRIALFGYAHVPWVAPHQSALEQFELPSAEARMRLFGLAYDRLTGAGYEHIGMDHFARPGDELLTALHTRTLTRNFMGYTTHRGLDLLGLGASAISSVGMSYTQNAKTVLPYLQSAARGAWWKALVISPEDAVRREIILALFCNFHLDAADLERRFNLNFSTHFAPEIDRLAPMIADGLVKLEPGAVTVTDLGRFFIRNICMVFDRYLAPGPGPAYSRTI